ncbi:MAG: single-stranded DNA-binding protein [Steroidobacteraceae bacterium]
MIDALIAGHVHGKPQARTSKNGNRFATTNVRASLREGNTVFVNVIAFDSAAVNALLALEAGDAVTLAGELTPKVYTPASGEPRPSLDLLAHAVLTEYHVARKRKAVQARDGGEGEAA